MSKLDFRQKGKKRRTETRKACVVMTYGDRHEAEQMGRQMEDLDAAGRLIMYEDTESLLHNSPASRVSMVILAAGERPPLLRKTLGHVRRRWPRCHIAVVGDEGCGEQEKAAREGGANYVLRSAARHHLPELLRHALGTHRRAQDRASG